MAGEHGKYYFAVGILMPSQLRLYSRDLELSNQNVLHREPLMSPAVILSLVDNSLLVYTTDNALFHYLVVPTADTIKLYLAGSISFRGVIANPNAVRVLSWMIPTGQKRRFLWMLCGTNTLSISFFSFVELGDPADDLAVATVLMMVGGELVLLKPRKVCTFDVSICSDSDPNFGSLVTKKCGMTCRSWLTGSSFAGYIYVASGAWKILYGVTMGKACGSGSTR